MKADFLGWLDDPPSGPAVVTAGTGQTWSYAGLAARVTACSKKMAGGRKALVACICRPDAGSAVAYLATLAAGHAAMMIDGAAARPVVDDLLDRYRPDYVIDGEDVVRLSSPGHPIDDDLAVLLGTSGSTGTAKYVRLGRRNLNANAAQIVDALGIHAEERAALHLPLHYSYGLSVLNSHLLARASVVFPDASIVRRQFWDAVTGYACTSLAGVPYTYVVLERVGFAGRNLPRLRTLTQAGGRMEPETVVRFARHMFDRGGRLMVMYGQTEATARIAYLPPDRVLDKPDRVGVAVQGGSLSLADDGELIYEGPNVMLGYAQGRSELADGDVNRGHLATGDLATVDDDGLYAIVGRKRRIAKLNGRRINLDELESLLAAHGPVAAVEAGGRLIVARGAGGSTSAQDLARQVGRIVRLPTRFLRVLEVGSLPRSSTGKTDYTTLRDELGGLDG